MKKAAYELNDAMMELVNGGDSSNYDGDVRSSLYQVGDIVEVYYAFNTTNRAYICSVEWSDSSDSWLYRVEFLDDFAVAYHTAKDFQK